MLARRIIPVILYRGSETFKGEGFESWRRIGNLRQAVRVFQSRNVDELILLDISGGETNVSLVSEFASDLFMPLTVGGGVRTLEHFARLINGGADKVSLNTAAVENPDIIRQAAEKFGRQAVVVSIDVKGSTVHTRNGTRDTGLDPVEFAEHVQNLGAGEILLNRIERDGTLQGYDLDLIGRVASKVSIPVIASGGAGSYDDLKAGLDCGAHAVAAGALWSFCDATPDGAANHLAKLGVPVRLRLVA